MMVSILMTAATTQLIDIEQAKEFLRIDDFESNDLIIDLIQSATKQAESYCNCAFLSQAWSTFYEADELDGVLAIPVAPVININNVFYYLESDDSQNVFAATNYRVDKFSKPGRFTLKSTGSWPSALRNLNAFEIQYSAGFGGLVTDVPGPIKQAVKSIVTHLFESREGEVSDIPSNAKKLLDPYVVYSL